MVLNKNSKVKSKTLLKTYKCKLVMVLKNCRKRFKFHTGFTLIEVLIAITVMGCMFIGLLQMVFFGMQAETAVRHRIYAQQVLTQRVEFLKTLPLDDPFLIDDGDTADLNNINPSDFIDSLIYRDVPFEVLWNIADNIPFADMKTIRMYVLWNNRNQRIFTDIVLWEGAQ